MQDADDAHSVSASVPIAHNVREVQWHFQRQLEQQWDGQSSLSSMNDTVALAAMFVFPPPPVSDE